MSHGALHGVSQRGLQVYFALFALLALAVAGLVGQRRLALLFRATFPLSRCRQVRPDPDGHLERA